MSELTQNLEDQYVIAKKYARQGAYLRKIKIDGSWVSKCFLRVCPRCSKKLPGMLSVDGMECCITPKCGYQRVVYTPAELSNLGR